MLPETQLAIATDACASATVCGANDIRSSGRLVVVDTVKLYGQKIRRKRGRWRQRKVIFACVHNGAVHKSRQQSSSGIVSLKHDY